MPRVASPVTIAAFLTRAAGSITTGLFFNGKSACVVSALGDMLKKRLFKSLLVLYF